MSLPLPKPFPLQFQNQAVTFPPFNSAAALHFGPQIPADPDPKPVQNVVTNSSAQISIELANKELWQKFDKVGNEMVVTKPGRKMFPKLELNLRGLDPKGQYGLVMYMEKIDNNRYKYQAGGWSPTGQDDNGPMQSNSVEHHEGWNSGEFWASQERITFERVKLTNKEGNNKTLISLCSMQKYQPIIILFQCLPNSTNLSMSSSIVYKFRPKECKFIAVTAYQSEALTNLKIEFNPFAKGFREGSSRKRGASDLSPTRDHEQQIGPAALLNSSLFSASSNSSTNISPSQSLNYCPPPKRPLILATEHFPTAFPSSFPSATAAAQFAAVAMLANQQQKQQQIYGQNQHQFGHQFSGWQWPSPTIIGQQPFVESGGTAASLSTFYQNLWQQIWMANNQQQQKKKEEGNQQGQIVVNDDGIKK